MCVVSWVCAWVDGEGKALTQTRREVRSERTSAICMVGVLYRARVVVVACGVGAGVGQGLGWSSEAGRS